MAHCSYTHTLVLPDGKEIGHTAEALRYWHEADGVVVVEAACCGQVGGLVACGDCPGPSCRRCGGSGLAKGEDTRSRHVFYDIGRDTSSGPIDAEAEVLAHVQRVAEHHAAAHRSRLTRLDKLVKHPLT